MLEVVDRVIDGIKKAREVAQRIHDAELQNALADVMMNSAQLKMDMAGLRDENVQLRLELENTKARQDVRSKLEHRNSLYYFTEPLRGYSQGPFCPRCLDCDGRLVALLGPGWQPGVDKGSGVFRADDGTGWTCPECVRGRR